MVDLLLKPEKSFSNGIAIIIDVLRATSTIVTALCNGAPFVLPVRTLSQARKLRKKTVVLGGERGGVKPADFDLGNSPLEYTQSALDGRGVILSTTNGTRAISLVRAREMAAACFLNLNSAVRAVSENEEVLLVCAGSYGKPSFEDTLCAGAIIYSSGRKDLTDSARVAKYLWKENRSRSLVDLLLESSHGMELCRYGFSEDIDYCAQMNITDILPTAKYLLSERGVQKREDLRKYGFRAFQFHHL